MDDCCNTHGSMAAWAGDRLYDRQFYSYPAGRCHCYRADQSHSGAEAHLAIYAYKQMLSERIVTVVQVYLINEGVITRDRLTTIGYGETNPAMYEAAPREIYSKAAKANMRVLFEIVVH